MHISEFEIFGVLPLLTVQRLWLFRIHLDRHDVEYGHIDTRGRGAHALHTYPNEGSGGGRDDGRIFREGGYFHLVKHDDDCHRRRALSKHG